MFSLLSFIGKNDILSFWDLNDGVFVNIQCLGINLTTFWLVVRQMMLLNHNTDVTTFGVILIYELGDIELHVVGDILVGFS